MFEQDYLMRMILQLVAAIRQSMEKAGGEDHDPAAAAELIEAGIASATELDGSVLLSLAPGSIASILQVTGTDPHVVEYVGRSLLLESSYLHETGSNDKADLRAQQARALAHSYGFDLDETDKPKQMMCNFLERDALSSEKNSSNDGIPS
ncbi:MAG: hypothetical protein LKF76_04030 [Eggerthellaceae bacterium]|jgi:hypothetical protein|nr:hypothetical protein [Eggerthellaceae bacterium]